MKVFPYNVVLLVGLLLLTIFPFFLYSRVITIDEAEKAAESHIRYKSSSIDKSLYFKIKFNESLNRDGVPVIYIFDVEPRGFVIVSGEDNVMPVLAYSIENNYGSEPIPAGFTEWLNWCAIQVDEARQKALLPSFEITSAWKNLLNYDSNSNMFEKGSKSVSPLMTSLWDQGAFYNDLCPIDAMGPNGRVWAGCVATSMAQVMHYYQFPYQGNGSHYYIHPVYGYQYADFGSTVYDWVPMLNSINSSNLPIATLLYQCGVSVEMNYSPSGSGAYMGTAAYALRNHFRYSNTVALYERNDYQNSWDDLITSNLDAGRPVIYAGFNPYGSSGHAFVADGYDAGGHFHFNWGWGGAYNGYFYTSNLNPGSSDFTVGQQAIVNIFPFSAYPPNCSNKVYTYPAGVFSDGSGPGDYLNNSDCSWLIEPQGVDKIKLRFLKFNTEAANDKVIVYDGADENTTVLGTFSGNNIPSVITSTGNKMFIRFISNSSIRNKGWVAEYSSVKSLFCDGTVTLDSPSGSFDDGSGNSDYNNNSNCKWLIAPQGVSSITISFSEFEVEPVYDYVRLIDPTKSPPVTLATFSGFNIPAPFTFEGSQMLVLFKTGNTNTYKGWAAEYFTLPANISEFGSGQSDVVISPNPAKDFFNIEMMSRINSQTYINLYDESGRPVYAKIIGPENFGNVISVNCGYLAKGFYIIRLQNNELIYTGRLIIQ